MRPAAEVERESRHPRLDTQRSAPDRGDADDLPPAGGKRDVRRRGGERHLRGRRRNARRGERCVDGDGRDHRPITVYVTDVA